LRPLPEGFVRRHTEGRRVSDGWYFDYGVERVPPNRGGPGSGIGGAPGFLVRDDGEVTVIDWPRLQAVLESGEVVDTSLPEDLYDACLDSVCELLFAPLDEPGLPVREAVALYLGGRSLVIEALTDSSELRVSLGDLKAEEPDYLLRDASEDEHF